MGRNHFDGDSANYIVCPLCPSCKYFKKDNSNFPYKCTKFTSSTAMGQTKRGAGVSGDDEIVSSCEHYEASSGQSSSSDSGSELAGAAVGGLAVGAGIGAAKGIGWIIKTIFKGFFLMFKYMFIGIVILWKKIAVPQLKDYASRRRIKINELESVVNTTTFDNSICEKLDTVGIAYNDLRKTGMGGKLAITSYFFGFVPLYALVYFFNKEPGTSKTEVLKNTFAKFEEGIQKLNNTGDINNSNRYSKELKKMRTGRIMQFVIPVITVIAIITIIFILLFSIL